MSAPIFWLVQDIGNIPRPLATHGARPPTIAGLCQIVPVALRYAPANPIRLDYRLIRHWVTTRLPLRRTVLTAQVRSLAPDGFWQNNRQALLALAVAIVGLVRSRRKAVKK